MTAPGRDPETLLLHDGFVRSLARSLLADTHQAEDLAQEAWVAALSGGPRKAESLRGWLAAVVRHLSLNLSRGEFRRRRRELVVARPERTSSAAEILEREMARRRVVDAVLGMGEPYRSAVILRYFDDLPPRAIAKQLGVPVETVRTRVKRGLDLLRGRLDGEWGGDRRAWCLALQPLASSRGTGTSVLTPEISVGLLASKVALKAAAAAVVLLGLSILLWPRGETPGGSPTPPPEDGRTASAKSPAVEEGVEVKADPDLPAGPARRRVEPEPRVTGTVVDPDGRPVAGATVHSFPQDPASTTASPDLGRGIIAGKTDERGRFDVGLVARAPAYNLLVEAAGFSPATSEGVRSGEDRTIELEAARALAGTVMDGEGRPVPGARVRWYATISSALLERETVAAEDGTYRIGGLPSRGAIWRNGSEILQWSAEARAEAFAPLVVTKEWGRAGTNDDLALNLVLCRGATLEGRVIDGESASPIAGARVVFWSSLAVVGQPRGAGISIAREPLPLGEVVSGADGTFTFDRIPAEGFHRVRNAPSGRRGALVGMVGALVEGYAPASEEVPLASEGVTLEAVIRCWPKATVRGRVVDRAGKPVPGALVAGYREHWTGWIPRSYGGPPAEATTDEEGRYSFDWVPALRSVPASVKVSARFAASHRRVTV